MTSQLVKAVAACVQVTSHIIAAVVPCAQLYSTGLKIRVRNSLIRSSLICSSLICSFAQITWVTVSDLLKSLRTNERLWANCSGCSWQMSDSLRLLRSLIKKAMWANCSGRSPKMSDHELVFAKVAHQKWANELITFFEQVAHSLIIRRFFEKNEWFAQKTDERIHHPVKNCFSVRYSLTEICFGLDLVLALKDEKQCCGAGAVGTEMLWDLEPEPKLYLIQIYYIEFGACYTVQCTYSRMKKKSIKTYFLWNYCYM